MLSFVLGAISGAVAATYWHPQLNQMRTDRVPEIRHRLADKVETLERALVEGIGALSTRARDALRGTNAANDGAPASMAPRRETLRQADPLT